MQEIKVCARCGGEFPPTTDFFGRDKNKDDGLKTWCKKCYNEYLREYRQDNRDVINERQRQYKLDNRQVTLDSYNKYAQQHREAISEYGKRYKLENKETLSAYFEHYRHEHLKERRILAHRRRAKIKRLPATLTVEQWETIKQCFSHECAYCGKKKVLTQDHLVAVKNDGEYTRDNIVPACRSCNSSKKEKNFFSWYPGQPFYSKEREEKLLKHLGYKKLTQQLSIF